MYIFFNSDVHVLYFFTFPCTVFFSHVQYIFYFSMYSTFFMNSIPNFTHEQKNLQMFSFRCHELLNIGR